MLGFGDAGVAKNHHIPSSLNNFLAHMAFPKKMLSILRNCYPNSTNVPIPSDRSDVFIYFFWKQNTSENRVVSREVNIFASLSLNIYLLLVNGKVFIKIPIMCPALCSVLLKVKCVFHLMHNL